MRIYHVIIGSKAFFEKYIPTQDEWTQVDFFLDLVRKSDEQRKFRNYDLSEIKTDILIVKNDHYHGIVETAHDRLGGLIEDLTTDDATIYIHNPPAGLKALWEQMKARNLIDLVCNTEQHQINRDAKNFAFNIQEIEKHIIGQEMAVQEISKSLWYLTSVDRKKPYVIMLYGGSSLGKTEIVREIAKYFFKNKFFETHLSMYKNDKYSDYFFGQSPNRRSLGFDLLERESNLIFLDELDKCPEYFYSAFYTLFDNTIFKDAVYDVDISGTLIILTSNYADLDEMKDKLGLPIYYRIDKFVHFEDFSPKTVYEITMNEIRSKVSECPEKLSVDGLYKMVSPTIQSTGENARTIKNKVRAAVETLLFQEVFNSVAEE